ncbi:MAG: FliM/FliN family flagellar motor switch protein [Kofleriaceae bacterium]
MAATGPNFSPYPFERIARLTRHAATVHTAIARWMTARTLHGPFTRLARLAGGPVTIRMIGIGNAAIDPHAAFAEVRSQGQSIIVAGSSSPVRRLAYRLLGGPNELGAPRPLGHTEQAIWALAVAAIVEDTGVRGDVWPLLRAPAAAGTAIELELDLAGTIGTIVVIVPDELVVRMPPAGAAPTRVFELPIVVGRCAVHRDAARRLSYRDVVTLERPLDVAELVIGDGSIGLSARPGALEAVATTGYIRRDVALPDDAHLELTVQLGTSRLSLRQLGELAVGQVVTLGRPLSGPFEVRAGGQLLGHGELIDVEGELGVRIVSLHE